MSLERAKTHLAKYGLEGNILRFGESTATVELAARAVGCEEARIVKTLSFRREGGCILLLAAGDARVDNAKFKKTFGIKASMLTRDEAAEMTGHEVGGVCPFGVTDKAKAYIDKSVSRFESVFPAAGESNCCVEMTLGQLEKTSESLGWVDVCKGWNE